MNKKWVQDSDIAPRGRRCENQGPKGCHERVLANKSRSQGEATDVAKRVVRLVPETAVKAGLVKAAQEKTVGSGVICIGARPLCPKRHPFAGDLKVTENESGKERCRAKARKLVVRQDQPVARFSQKAKLIRLGLSATTVEEPRNPEPRLQSSGGWTVIKHLT